MTVSNYLLSIVQIKDKVLISAVVDDTNKVMEVIDLEPVHR